MAGQHTRIILADYNSIQSKIANVLGDGSSDYGYGQVVSSVQLAPRTTIAATQWNHLSIDLLKARQHQTGVVESLPVIQQTHEILESDRAAYAAMADLVVTYRTARPPSSQATLEALAVSTVSVAWNGTVTNTVTVNFASAEAARFFFNTGSSIDITASRTGGSSSTKNASWTTMLTNMQTISFRRSATVGSGSGTASQIGYANVTTSNQLIFQKLTEAPVYSPNQYDIYVRQGSTAAQLIFTIQFADLAGPNPNYDENIDGTLTSTVQVYRASGSNVSVAHPTATGSITSGTTTTY